MARTRTATKTSTRAAPKPDIDKQVGTQVRRITQAMSTYSRSMLAGSMSTPFDAMKPGNKLPVVGDVGPQSTGYYLPPLVRFSRHLDRNEGFTKRGLDIRADATVGTGPWPEFQFQALNDLFEEWMEDCDKRGKMSLGQIARQMRRSTWSSAESFLTMHDEPMTSERIVPLSIKGIEMDHVDSFDTRMNPQTGNRIISGIEIDIDDAPVAVWVLPYHPHDMHMMSRWEPSRRVPIADVCHMFDEAEFSSVRGIPILAPAIVKAVKSMQFENANIARMIGSALYTGWAKTTDKSAAGARMPGEEEVDDWVSDILLEPGAFNVLPYGIEVEFNSPPDAGQTYESVMKMSQRYAAAVMGVLYQEMTGDWENASDRTHRAATLSISRAIDRDRANDEQKVWRKVARRFVDRAYLSGAWKPDESVPQREWYKHDWHWPAKRYQNLFQEFNAYALAIEKDLMDRDNAIGELFGLDARKVDRAQAKAKARKAALESGPAADIITAEVAKDELEIAQTYAKSDDDAVGLRKPVSGPRSIQGK